MLYQGIIGGGSSPVEPVDLSPVLLWTNPSPGTEFAAQTVSLDLSEYAGVIVEFNANTNTSNYQTCTRVFCKKSDPEYFGGGAVPASGALGRTLRITNEGVFFGNGFSAASTTNGTAIPTKIYGVKEYVVEPVGTQMGVYAIGNNPSEQYANCLIENCKFKKLKVVSYENIASSESSYPKISINDVQNTRPAVGTIFDVYNKKVSITSLAGVGEYAKVGIVVEFI